MCAPPPPPASTRLHTATATFTSRRLLGAQRGLREETEGPLSESGTFCRRGAVRELQVVSYQGTDAPAVRQSLRRLGIYRCIDRSVALTSCLRLLIPACADGLRYEDVMVVTPDIDTALRRMDPYDVDMRNKRLKRAADLSVKHTYLPYELQEKHDPWADSSALPRPPWPVRHKLQPLADQPSFCRCRLCAGAQSRRCWWRSRRSAWSARPSVASRPPRTRQPSSSSRDLSFGRCILGARARGRARCGSKRSQRTGNGRFSGGQWQQRCTGGAVDVQAALST